MDTGVIYMALIGLFIWIGILYLVIREANSTTKRDKIQLQNQKLLALIAEKLGVEKERILPILDPETKVK